MRIRRFNESVSNRLLTIEDVEDIFLILKDDGYEIKYEAKYQSYVSGDHGYHSTPNNINNNVCIFVTCKQNKRGEIDLIKIEKLKNEILNKFKIYDVDVDLHEVNVSTYTNSLTFKLHKFQNEKQIILSKAVAPSIARLLSPSHFNKISMECQLNANSRDDVMSILNQSDIFSVREFSQREIIVSIKDNNLLWVNQEIFSNCSYNTVTDESSKFRYITAIRDLSRFGYGFYDIVIFINRIEFDEDIKKFIKSFAQTTYSNFEISVIDVNNSKILAFKINPK